MALIEAATIPIPRANSGETGGFFAGGDRDERGSSWFDKVIYSRIE
jgi:hypothetical protein